MNALLTALQTDPTVGLPHGRDRVVAGIAVPYACWPGSCVGRRERVGGFGLGTRLCSGGAEASWRGLWESRRGAAFPRKEGLFSGRFVAGPAGSYADKGFSGPPQASSIGSTNTSASGWTCIGTPGEAPSCGGREQRPRWGGSTSIGAWACLQGSAYENVGTRSPTLFATGRRGKHGWRKTPSGRGKRLGRGGLLFDSLVPTDLAQGRVTTAAGRCRRKRRNGRAPFLDGGIGRGAAPVSSPPLRRGFGATLCPSKAQNSWQGQAVLPTDFQATGLPSVDRPTTGQRRGYGPTMGVRRRPTRFL